MAAFILIVVIIFGVGLLLRFLDEQVSSKPRSSRYAYKAKQSLITNSEKNFLSILQELFGNQYYINSQVHLDALLDSKVEGQYWKAASSHINRKSVDFVICDRENMRPLVAIELDDKTHLYADRKDRDVEVERILAEAGITLERFYGQGRYSRDLIQKLVSKHL